MVINQAWPKSKLINIDISNVKIKIALQINGKTKSILEVAVSANQKDIEQIALSDKKIIKNLKNKKPKRIIFVPKKVINIVI